MSQFPQVFLSIAFSIGKSQQNLGNLGELGIKKFVNLVMGISIVEINAGLIQA